MVALYAGLDVSLELTSICVVDEEGRMLLETKAASEPDAISRELHAIAGDYVRVGLEADPLSQWLFFGLQGAEFLVVCIEARHAKAAMVAMNRNKNDRNDLDRSTLADWVGKSTALLEPLADAIGRHVLAGEAIFADDTPVRMLAPGTGKTQTARLWVYARDERPWGGDAPLAACYRFSGDRKGKHPKDHLARFSG